MYLNLAVMVMRGVVFHLLFCMVLISGSYLVLWMRVCSGKLSWEYVSPMSWIVCGGGRVI